MLPSQMALKDLHDDAYYQLDLSNTDSTHGSIPSLYEIVQYSLSLGESTSLWKTIATVA